MTLLYYAMCDGQLKRWIVVERLDSFEHISIYVRNAACSALDKVKDFLWGVDVKWSLVTMYTLCWDNSWSQLDLKD